MAVALALTGLAAAATLACLAAVELARHARAARAQHAAGCDDDDTTALATRLRLAADETRHVVAGVAAAMLPQRRPPVPDAGHVIVVATTSFAAHGAARRLVAALRRAGAGDVVVARLGGRWRGLGAAAPRLARALAVLPAARVTLVAHGLAGLAARTVSAEHPRVQRVVTLGTPHGRRAGRPPAARLEAVAIASPDDPHLVPVGVASWPGACNVSIRGVGHLGMLRDARVHALVVESLADPVLRPAPSAPEHGHGA